MATGLSATGFVRKTETDLFAEIVAEGRATITPALDDAEDTVFGAYAGIVASKLAECWELLELIYNAFSPNAGGDALDRVGALTNTLRLVERYSFVTAQVTMSSAGPFAAGSIVATVSGNSSARFTSQQSISGPGTKDVLMRADKTGPVAAPAGTLTVLEGPPAGVTSIGNIAAASLGAFEEDDAAYRVRRDAELEASGSSTVDALRVDVARVDAIAEVVVYTNRSNATDSAGRPPKSVEVVVVGDNPNGVAQAIWESLAGGIEAYSATGHSGTALDAEGNQQVVAFSRASNRRLYLRITGTKDPNTYPGDIEFRRFIEGFTTGQVTIEASNGNEVVGTSKMGGKVYRSKISAAAQTVTGVEGISNVELSVNGTSWTTVDYQLGAREYLGKSPTERGIRFEDITAVMT